MATAAGKKTVCVMDASGRLGSALVDRLLLDGYIVHAALHSRHDLERYKGEWSENDSLRVFHSDPLDYHSITDALRGCCALFYSFELPSDHPTYDELIGELEVRAAHNVLEACAQTESIDKVVFTSSATAVIWRDCQRSDAPPTPSDSRMDERNWSDINFCKKLKLWHGVSKTMAERTAWALAMDRGVNMVSINGGLLMCQDLSIKDPYLLGAAEMFKDGVFVTVDLKFLVDAHICVFEDPSSYGRYLCFNRTISCTRDVQKLASRLLPPPSTAAISEDDRVYQQRISNHKLNKLMVDYYGGAAADQ
ncbi:cinnamoyl-CoA reductase-like SNL6 [Andrographis paniculata]|uniref:cinnamoyl-CoA reductase-like SNL6 n=1 Tax=Andrographis paniculata TaxID=175694 RepID=UPI0021E92A8E|nr:cinnamoyl-CoA reductase-like SNL6 [Andrographis paniculata]XP_051142365.1 cinnamoyl-CoA reductase-like SNL6 [Andrographis paniculata]XP_051142366.1 cinnamoyl-CoA reductase-like SNL6 [Andrographis paniculata]XP_051142367.1 cinnamoyl-CoA reductase-like SNL6 [Andrographis paniculata]